MSADIDAWQQVSIAVDEFFPRARIMGHEAAVQRLRDELDQHYPAPPREPSDAEVRAVMKVCREFYSTPVGVGPQFARAVIFAAREAVAAAALAEAGERGMITVASAAALVPSFAAEAVRRRTRSQWQRRRVSSGQKPVLTVVGVSLRYPGRSFRVVANPETVERCLTEAGVAARLDAQIERVQR